MDSGHLSSTVARGRLYRNPNDTNPSAASASAAAVADCLRNHETFFNGRQRSMADERTAIKAELRRHLSLLALDLSQSTPESNCGDALHVGASPNGTNCPAASLTSSTRVTDIPLSFERLLADNAQRLLTRLVETHPQHQRHLMSSNNSFAADGLRAQSDRSNVSFASSRMASRSKGRLRSLSFTSSSWDAHCVGDAVLREALQRDIVVACDVFESVRAAVRGDDGKSSSPLSEGSSYGAAKATTVAEQAWDHTFPYERLLRTVDGNDVNRDAYESVGAAPASRSSASPRASLLEPPLALSASTAASLAGKVRSSSVSSSTSTAADITRQDAASHNKQRPSTTSSMLLPNPFLRFVESVFVWDQEQRQANALCARTLLQARDSPVDADQAACSEDASESSPVCTPLGHRVSNEMETAFVEEVRVGSLVFDLLDTCLEPRSCSPTNVTLNRSLASNATTVSSASCSLLYFPLSDGRSIGVIDTDLESTVLDHITLHALQYGRHPVVKCLWAFVDAQLPLLVSCMHQCNIPLVLETHNLQLRTEAFIGGEHWSQILNSWDVEMEFNALDSCSLPRRHYHQRHSSGISTFRSHDAHRVYNLDTLAFITSLTEVYAQRMFLRRSIPVTLEFPSHEEEGELPLQVCRDWRLLAKEVLLRLEPPQDGDTKANQYGSSRVPGSATLGGSVASTSRAGSLRTKLKSFLPSRLRTTTSTTDSTTGVIANERRARSVFTSDSDDDHQEVRYLDASVSRGTSFDRTTESNLDGASREPSPGGAHVMPRPVSFNLLSASSAQSVPMKVCIGRIFRSHVPALLAAVLQSYVLSVVLEQSMGCKWWAPHADVCASTALRFPDGTDTTRLDENSAQSHLLIGCAAQLASYLANWLGRLYRSTRFIDTTAPDDGGDENTATANPQRRVSRVFDCDAELRDLVAVLEQVFSVVEFAAVCESTTSSVSAADGHEPSSERRSLAAHEVGADVLLPLIVLVVYNCPYYRQLLTLLKWLDGGLYAKAAELIKGKGARAYIFMTFLAAMLSLEVSN